MEATENKTYPNLPAANGVKPSEETKPDLKDEAKVLDSNLDKKSPEDRKSQTVTKLPELEKLLPTIPTETTNVELETGKVVDDSIEITKPVEPPPVEDEEPVYNPDDEPRIRFFAVGPSEKKVKCPLCGAQGETKLKARKFPCEGLPCCLSMLSCCFPIFWICFFVDCLLPCVKTKRHYCPQCKGYLGIYQRPQK